MALIQIQKPRALLWHLLGYFTLYKIHLYNNKPDTMVTLPVSNATNRTQIGLEMTKNKHVNILSELWITLYVEYVRLERSIRWSLEKAAGGGANRSRDGR